MLDYIYRLKKVYINLGNRIIVFRRCIKMGGSTYKAEDLPLIIQPEVREKCNN